MNLKKLKMAQRRRGLPPSIAARLVGCLLGLLCIVLTKAFVNGPFLYQGHSLLIVDRIHHKYKLSTLLFSTLQDKGKAYPQQTPHSGRKFLPSHPAYRRKLRLRRRFTEGWYYRLTLPGDNVSFAFIISIEDPGIQRSNLKLACIQVIGPDNTYLVQADRDDTKFWAWKHQQALGYTFEYQSKAPDATITAMEPAIWRDTVKSGFQVLPTHLQGRIHGHDGSMGGVLEGQGIPGCCEFDFEFTPLCGWGDVGKEQKSTAGWLASFSVFEPHWQVTVADARATGTVTWENVTYTFQDAPFYAEKNWGAALPTKWYWTQCNSFDGYSAPGEPQLTVTAGGGVRQTPIGKETLGMICVHYNGVFYEAVPWTGAMEWEVATWGSWILKGKCTSGERPFEVQFTCKCDPEENPGLVFRAPTPDEGMVYFCRDTFEADCVLSLWELVYDEKSKTYVRRYPIIDAATSRQGGAEVGGGPWWDTWRRVSDMRQPLKGLVQLPYRIDRLRRKISRTKQHHKLAS